jgi:DNA repair protein REV1
MEGVDEDFLAAMPPELKKELAAEQKRLRLKEQAKLEAQRRKQEERERPRPPKQTLHLPERAPRPTFTNRKLCALPELRAAITDWVGEFKREGPYPEDAAALGVYLGRVVQEERDMDKAVACVKWLGWLVEDELPEDDAGNAGLEKWREAVDKVAMAVQAAMKERNLGRVDL